MIDTALWIGGALVLSWPLAGLHWLGYRSWRKTTGTVVRIEADPNPTAGDGVLTAPVVAFTLPDGLTIEATDAVRTNTKLRIGQRVEVIYPPDTPQSARVAGNLYTLQLVIGAVGVVILLVGLFGNA